MTRWTKDYFRQNRKKLGQSVDGGVVVLASYAEVQRRNDMAQRFTQEPNIWYLTGINEPGWRMIYDGARDRCWLVRPEADDEKLIFDGGSSDDEVLRLSGADEIIAWNDQESVLRQLARKHSTVYAIDPKRAHKGFNFFTNPALGEVHAVLARIFSSVTDISSELADQRAIKSQLEVDAIRQAVNITTLAFRDIREKLPTMTYEYQIEAEFTYAFRRQGSDHAYDPIVASGKNACTLHYTANNSKRKVHSAVLIDVGAEHDGYCADITRTYAWGRPTRQLVELHQALENAQKEIISGIIPHMPISEYLRMTDSIMKRNMISVGLLKDDQDERYRDYFPHAISHGLGIDVHDSLGTSRTLLPGMVLTVEPGLYINTSGIGIRIEDDILITKDVAVNLSAGLSTSLLD